MEIKISRPHTSLSDQNLNPNMITRIPSDWISRSTDIKAGLFIDKYQIIPVGLEPSRF